MNSTRARASLVLAAVAGVLGMGSASLRAAGADVAQAAREGNPPACVRLGAALAQGQGMPKDELLAAEWFGKAVAGFRALADQGHPRARFASAAIYDEDAHAGYDVTADAMWMMAEALLGGVETARDETEAATWFRRALPRYRSKAESGSPLACLHMADACTYGKGTAQDANEAASWYRRAAEGYRKAADGNDPQAMFMLANLYMRGQGVDKGAAEGIRLYRRAAELGHVKAMETLGFIFSFDTLTDVGRPLNEKEDQKKVIAQHIHWLRLAAERGSLAGHLHMHEAYIGGEGGVVEKDANAAMAWLRKGLEGRDERDIAVQKGMAILAKAYEQGQGTVDKDPGKAAELFGRLLRQYRRRADWGDAEAQCLVGDMYASGRGVPQDQAQALAWYDKAAANGSARAKTTLSKLRPPTQSASAPAHGPVK